MTKPPFIEALEKNDPALLKQMVALNEFASKDGALSAKVKTLMSMFGDAILNHPEGVRVLADRARAQGASEEEINETVRMAFLFAGLPGLVIATSAFPKKG
jgi:alkylhydroperoxidase/carboxymuconolactone decarboxylase family protein YurZ